MQMRGLLLAAVVLWPALAAAELRHVEIKTLGMD
jgi:hypothetical protein